MKGVEKPKNFTFHCYRRELGKRVYIDDVLPPSIERRIDNEYKKTLSQVKALTKAVKTFSENDIATTVGDIVAQMVEGLQNSSGLGGRANLIRKQQRELFVAFGGMKPLMKLLAPPFVPPDARSITASKIRQKSEYYNEILVIFRELLMTVPAIVDNYFTNRHLVFLFTLLHHQPLFENVMNILEELLASREDTFSLATIPRFYELVRGFSARHLAHFCRVLSLLVFEPEDRQIMEATHVLKSLELLLLRRNRMARSSAGMVERNQNLLIEMPEFLPRILQIMRVINYGPNLYDLISHNIITQLPITSDILTFNGSRGGRNDWEHFKFLEERVEELNELTTTNMNHSRTTTIASSSSSSSSSQQVSDNRADEEFSQELLNAFAPTMNGNQRTIELSNLVNVIHVAQRLGIAELTPLGQALLLTHPITNNAGGGGGRGGRNNNNNRTPRGNTELDLDDIDEMALAMERLSRLRTPTVNSRNSHSNRSTEPDSSASYSLETLKRFRNELKFHAMLLIHHQIELVFVICTLLSGRRKLAVQQKLANLGMGKILTGMFSRMSWDRNAVIPPDQNHIHGANCECNPESAIRVQYLRLIHNFYDRDFLGNQNKLLVLSNQEKDFILNYEHYRNYTNSSFQISSELLLDQGLLIKVAHTLLKEKPNSTYRFWLSACIENFLRGAGHGGQYLLVNLLPNFFSIIIQHIVDAVKIAQEKKKLANSSSFASNNSSSLLERKRNISIDSDDLEDSSCDISGNNNNEDDEDSNSTCNNSLQTSFDLLGELIKGNRDLVSLLEKSLDDEMFQLFISIIMNHLIESNVFLRSLFLSLEIFNCTTASYQSSSSSLSSSSSSSLLPEGVFDFSTDTLSNAEHFYLQRKLNQQVRGYMTESWIQFHCRPISTTSTELFTNSQFYQEERLRKAELRLNNFSSTFHQNQNNNQNSSAGSLSPSRRSISGMIGAMKDIRKATKHFLRFGDTSSDAPNVPPAAVIPPKPRPSYPISSSSSSTHQPMKPPASSSSSSSSSSSTSITQTSYNLHFPLSSSEPIVASISAYSSTDSMNNLPAAAAAAAQQQSSSSSISRQYGIILRERDIIETMQNSSGCDSSSDNNSIQSNSTTTVHPLFINRSNTTSPAEFDDLFYTPPEGPKFRRPSNTFGANSAASLSQHPPLEPVLEFPSSPLSPSSSSLPPSDLNLTAEQPPAAPAPIQSTPMKNPIVPIDLSTHQQQDQQPDHLQQQSQKSAEKSIPSSSSAHKKLELSDSFFRISMFIIQEKYSILFRLMTIISLRTINHENICCLNTTLLMLLFEHQRGQLAQTLKKIRQISDKQLRYERESSLSQRSQPLSSLLFSNTRNPPPHHRVHLDDDNDNTDHLKEEAKVEGQQSNSSELSGGEIVMRNFRELLWYWSEYYLRRGRDRLSIEFSCHIPFSYWYALVSCLCADNGSDTALVAHPIQLPSSPYVRSSNHVYMTKGGEIGSFFNLH